MLWSAWRLSARLALSSWVYRISTVWILGSLLVGIGSYVVRLIGIDASQNSFVFHYTVYLGIDDVRPLIWSVILPLIWLVSSLAFLLVAYGSYRRDPHVGMAWLIVAAASALPWFLALHYFALINR